MPIIDCVKTEQIVKLTWDQHSVLSLDHLAARVNMTDVLSGRGETIDGHLEDMVPSIVSDVHQFSRLVYAVRNSYFNLPNSMTYPKFRYVLQNMVHVAGTPSLLYLDPDSGFSVTECIEEMKSVSKEWLLWCSRLQVCRIANTADSVLSLPLERESRVTSIDNYLGFTQPASVNITYRNFEVLSVASEVDRIYLLRLLAAEAKNLPPRTLLLLIDASIPHDIIPGFNSLQLIVNAARAVTADG